jgi:hypothetical protein
LPSINTNSSVMINSMSKLALLSGKFINHWLG